jgi:hypothetical protein
VELVVVTTELDPCRAVDATRAADGDGSAVVPALLQQYAVAVQVVELDEITPRLALDIADRNLARLQPPAGCGDIVDLIGCQGTRGSRQRWRSRQPGRGRSPWCAWPVG